MAGVSKLGLFRIRRSSSGHGPLRGRPLPSPRRPPGCATCGAAGRGAPHRWCACCPPCTGRSCRAPAPASARLARPPRARPWPARATCPPPAPCAAARTAGLAHGGWPRAARAGRARPCASGPPAAAWRLYSCRSAARITRGEQSRHAMTDVQTVQCSSGAICHRHASVLCLVALSRRVGLQLSTRGPLTARERAQIRVRTWPEPADPRVWVGRLPVHGPRAGPARGRQSPTSTCRA